MTVMLEVVADVRERIFDGLASVDRVQTLRRRTSAVIAHLRGWTSSRTDNAPSLDAIGPGWQP